MVDFMDFHFDMITRKLKKTKAENQVGYFTLPSTTPDLTNKSEVGKSK